MNKFTALAGTGLLLIGAAAFAQDIPGPADSAATSPEPSMPAEGDPATDPAADSSEPLDPVTGDTGATAPMDHSTHEEAMPAPDAAAPTESAPVTPGTETAETAFTDEQIASFAAAALEIQNLQGDEATKQAQAATIVANSGIDPATFNAIGQAMQTDPAVAQRVQLAAAGLQSQPEG